MHQFNYHGPTRMNEIDENDIAGLEKEIDFIIRNQLLANAAASPNREFTKSMPSMGKLPKKRTKTAGMQSRKK